MTRRILLRTLAGATLAALSTAALTGTAQAYRVCNPAVDVSSIGGFLSGPKVVCWDTDDIQWGGYGRIGDPVGGQVRDHRGERVRDHRTNRVRDHRTNRVFDHRAPAGPAVNPNATEYIVQQPDGSTVRVRDHRTTSTITVRDHRTPAPPAGITVRDHRN